MAEVQMIRIYNKSKQTISLQARPPKGDFFLHEQQIRIGAGKSVTVAKDYLLESQINNLCKRQILQITYDSDVAKNATAMAKNNINK